MINFFARPSFIGNRFSKWSSKTQTLRVSSKVRAEEVVAILGKEATLNPTVTKKGDVNIYVKPETLEIVGKGDYLDFLDGGHFEEELLLRPDIKIIAATENSKDVLKTKFKNEIYLIPHHHINFERLTREKRPIKTCGYLGSYSPKTERHYNWLQSKFNELNVGMTIFADFEYKSRNDAINTYLKMDLLVIDDDWIPDFNPHKVPTKIINAMSFGIPVLASPRSGYKEVEGKYIQIESLNSLIEDVLYLKNHPVFYNDLVTLGLIESDKYHIDNILNFYRKLK